jgi:hypothetical protein
VAPFHVEAVPSASAVSHDVDESQDIETGVEAVAIEPVTAQFEPSKVSVSPAESTSTHRLEHEAATTPAAISEACSDQEVPSKPHTSPPASPSTHCVTDAQAIAVVGAPPTATESTDVDHVDELIVTTPPAPSSAQHDPTSGQVTATREFESIDVGADHVPL